MGSIFKKRLFFTALIFSLLAHVLFSVSGFLLQSLKKERLTLRQNETELTFLDLNENQDLTNKNLQQSAKQLAESAVADNSDTPEKGYEGLRNQRVIKETKAAKIGKLQSATSPQTQSSAKTLAQSQQHSPEKEQATQELSKKDSNQPPDQKALSADHSQSVSDAKLTTATTGDLEVSSATNTAEAARKNAKKAEKSTNESTNTPGLKSLLPSMSGQNAQFAEAQRDDTLRDVAVSGDTFLNTRESKYFTYYQRIKDRLREKLNPIMYEKVMDSYRRGRHLASSDETHTTQLMFILNAKGQLEKIYMMSASGMTELDETAMEALKVAAPFPNPPKGMIDDDGRVRIRWAFTYGDES